MAGAHVEDRVNRVETKHVDVKIGKPVERVFSEEAPNLVGIGTVEVDGPTPRCRVPVGEVRPVIREVVSLRAEMVVDDVEREGEPSPMAFVDEPAQAVRTAVARVWRVRKHSVVTPIAFAGKLRDGHELDRRDAQVLQIVELADYPLERSLRGESSYVKLVEDEVRERDAGPTLVGPSKRIARHDPRGAVHAARLKARARIGTLFGAIDDVEVVRSRAGVGQADLEHVARPAVHRDGARLGADDAEAELTRAGGPHAKSRRPIGERIRSHSAERFSHGTSDRICSMPCKGMWTRSGRCRTSCSSSTSAFSRRNASSSTRSS